LENGRDGDVNLFYTVLHELGHSLGLGHSSTTNSIMNPWYSSSRVIARDLLDLYDDDKLAIQELYGKTNSSRWGPNFYPGGSNKSVITRRPTTRPTERPMPPQRRPTPPATTQSPKPDTCNTNYDAIGVIRSELMIFKGRFMWRITNGRLIEGYPAKIASMWPKLADYDEIDAVFEQHDGKINFFVGQEVLVYSGTTLMYTHNLEYLGISKEIEKVDAVFRWGHNNKTFIFSGSQYWR